MRTNPHKDHTQRDNIIMLISNADMLYYTKPVPTSFHSTYSGEESIYVTVVSHPRHKEKIGTIQKVRKGTTDHLGNRWRITEDGDYVGGHVVNAVSPGSDRLIVGKCLPDDDVWFTGVSTGRETARYRIARHARFSDGRQMAGLNNMEDHGATFWLPGASWARDLMPVPEDSETVAKQKIALARARWEMNRAIAYVENEGRMRQWDDGLKDLHDDEGMSWLPRPMLNVFVEGTALIRAEARPVSPSDDELPEHVREALATVGNRSIGLQRRADAPVYPVPVTFSAPVEVTPEALNLQPLTIYVAREFQARFRGTNASLGNYTPYPYVGALSHYI